MLPQPFGRFVLRGLALVIVGATKKPVEYL
jgi:hypothetical protein